jgi:alpha-tubulin suppressor-like RCC1 family protein
MPKDDINYSYTENGIVYDFYDVFVPGEYFRLPALWVWGYNAQGQLGINATTNRTTPVTTFLGGTNWKSVSNGTYHSAAIKTDGTLWVWGYNGTGELGINDTATRTTPVTTILGGTNWKQVAVGRIHTAAIKTDGTLWTWGSGGFASLGINDTTSRSTPVTTFLGGTNWKSVACGSGGHTVAIKTDGTLWVWGRNNFGQLGIGVDINNRTTPVTTFLGGTDWKSVACGYYHTAAIKTDGTLWAWGFNVYGNLGTNDTATRTTPVTTFLGGTDWKQVAVGGGNHTTAIKTDGTLWTWGSNTNGQLGTNDIANRSIPVTTFLGGSNWKSVGGGGSHITAIKTDGTLWTCGRNSEGQLGINNIADRSTPVTTFLGGSNWKSVGGGYYYTAAIQYQPDP